MISPHPCSVSLLPLLSCPWPQALPLPLELSLTQHAPALMPPDSHWLAFCMVREHFCLSLHKLTLLGPGFQSFFKAALSFLVSSFMWKGVLYFPRLRETPGSSLFPEKEKDLRARA